MYEVGAQDPRARARLAYATLTLTTRQNKHAMLACTRVHDERYTTGDRQVHGRLRSADDYEVGAQDVMARARLAYVRLTLDDPPRQTRHVSVYKGP